MKNALILHGTQGNSSQNWYPWLKKELERRGYKVWLPDLPGADRPNLTQYNKFIFANSDFIFSKETVIVGHSSGSVEILALLNELADNIVVDTCILVAVFAKDSPGGKWEPNSDLFNYNFDYDKIKTKAKRFIFIISDNDQYCPLDYVERLAGDFKGELIITSGDGHFSVGSGGVKYKKLPLILTALDKK